MKNIKPFMKRLCAYTIDIVVITTISSLIASLPFLNKEMKDYQETYKEYQEEYQIYMDYISLLEESFQDETISEEEYNKLQEETQYQDILSSKYDDTKITKGEYKEIVSKIHEEFEVKINDYSYKLNKKNTTNSIITLVCTLIYFGILQYFLNGQTIGKKILKLQVVSATNKKLNIITFILRSLIINDILLNSVGVTFLILASKSTYLSISNIVSIAISIVEALIVYFVISREDGRGLHDLLFNTKVISTTKLELTNNKEKNDENIIDIAPENEEIENTKKKTKNRKK